MPKHELLFDVGEYAPVADRITLFYARFPMGRITTRLIARTEHEITVQAYVFRSVEEERPSAARSRTSASRRPRSDRVARRCSRPTGSERCACRSPHIGA